MAGNDQDVSNLPAIATPLGDSEDSIGFTSQDSSAPAGGLPVATPKPIAQKLPFSDQMDTLSKLQKGYQDLDSLLDAQKGQLGQVPWFQLAAAFLNPGKTGSFGEALGGAGAQLGDWRNKQISAAIPLAQQKLAIAQQQGAIAKQMMDLQGMQDYQKRTLDKGEVKVGDQDPAMSVASIQNMLLNKQKEYVAAGGNEPLQKQIMAEINTLKQNLDIHKEAHAEYNSARDYALKLYQAGMDASKIKLELAKAGFAGEISDKLIKQLMPGELPSAAPFAGSIAPSAPSAPAPVAAALVAAAPVAAPAAPTVRAPVSPAIAPTAPVAPPVAPAAPSGGGAGLSGKQLMEQKGANVKQAEEEAKKKLEPIVGFDPMANANSTQNLTYIRGMLGKPENQKLVGILQKQGVLYAIADGINRGVSTPWGSISLPIEEAAKKYSLSESEQATLQNIARRINNEALNAIRQNKSAFGSRMTNIDVNMVKQAQATPEMAAKAINEWAENSLLANHANKTLADQYNAWRGQNKGGSGWEFINGPYQKSVEDYSNMFSRLDKRRMGAQ